MNNKNYTINKKTGCWVWGGCLNADGYGVFKLHQKQYRASRYFYELFKKNIPKGLTIDHLCHNKRCVNPKHLEAVTIAENCRRRLNNKLNYKKVKKIRALYNKGWTQTKIANLFNVGQDHVSRIVNGTCWSLTK